MTGCVVSRRSHVILFLSKRIPHSVCITTSKFESYRVVEGECKQRLESQEQPASYRAVKRAKLAEPGGPDRQRSSSRRPRWSRSGKRIARALMPAGRNICEYGCGRHRFSRNPTCSEFEYETSVLGSIVHSSPLALKS
jgi:hypothetical protein